MLSRCPSLSLMWVVWHAASCSSLISLGELEMCVSGCLKEEIVSCVPHGVHNMKSSSAAWLRRSPGGDGRGRRAALQFNHSSGRKNLWVLLVASLSSPSVAADEAFVSFVPAEIAEELITSGCGVCKLHGSCVNSYWGGWRMRFGKWALCCIGCMCPDAALTQSHFCQQQWFGVYSFFPFLFFHPKNTHSWEFALSSALR